MLKAIQNAHRRVLTRRTNAPCHVIRKIGRAPRRKGPLRYVVSSLDLREWHAHLCAESEAGERQVLITGPISTDGLRVPSRMEALPLSHQSLSYVQLDDAAMARRVISLDVEHGHKVVLIAHSHILYGAQSTMPSQIDIRNQIRVADLGWNAIGCIFSLDGYVRFFDPSRDFEVQVYGKGFDVIETSRRNLVIKLGAGTTLAPVRQAVVT